MRRSLRYLAWAVTAYLVLAYLLLPLLWRHYEHAPSLASVPKYTVTADDVPGDPVNLALIGAEEEIATAFAAAGWRRPAPIDVRSSVAIAESVVLGRPDPDAPVSNLYLFGRKEDLAFEHEVGASARQRNHVRFWRAPVEHDGRAVWLGAATFDRGVGLSRRTGQITHHIGADVDAERDRVIGDLQRAGQLRVVFQVTGIGPTLAGYNGGGDRYYTDGELCVGVLKAHVDSPVAAPEVLPNSITVDLKNRVWRAIAAWLSRA